MDSQVNISAVIITQNEQDNIGRCLDSVADVADEIVVVDAFSTDATAVICSNQSVRFIQHPFEGHIEQKNYAMHQATHDYVLSLDADEALSETLKKSILQAKTHWKFDGYSLNRLTNYCGKWIKHCGWYPDLKIRLWDRRKGKWGGVNPHDRVIMGTGTQICHLEGDLLHYSYPSIRQHVSQINTYSDIAAREAFNNGRSAYVIIDILLNPALTFLKKYFLKLGVLDGYAGFMISIHTAYGKFLKYIKLRELHKKKDGSS
jgi:glycosyltransferase involved in cell wall biosynthesis